jgi:hypothetical protein
MNKDQAMQVLVQALEASAKAGVFSLSDSATIVKAINKINELVEIVPTEE